MRTRWQVGSMCGASLIALAGCASSTDNLQRASARLIGNNTSPESVGISNVQRGATEVRWTATARNGATYSCSADDMVRGPSCAKP